MLLRALAALAAALALALAGSLPAAAAASLGTGPLNPRVAALLSQLGRTRAAHEADRRIGGRDCLVTDPRFGGGAKCDNVTDDTLALQAAIDGCHDGGTVSLPPGKVCLSRGLVLCNGTQLNIPARSTLKALPDPSRWDNRSLYLIHAGSTRDTGILGGGTIDGSGNEWWKVAGGNRPHLFNNNEVRNYTIRDVKLINSGRGILGFGPPCSDIMVDNVIIEEPAIGNSDGIDVSCDGFVIQNSLVQNGDDSICMKSTAGGSARNGLIRNCTVRNGKQLLPATKNYPGMAGGLVLGTAIAPAMENITYSNCTVDGALAGIRIKFRPTQFGTVKNIVFEDIHIVNPVVYAIDVIMSSNHADDDRGYDSADYDSADSAVAKRQDQHHHHHHHHHHLAIHRGPQTVDLQGVTIRNVHGVLGPVPATVCDKGRICPRAVARFSCTDEFPCHNMRLEHIDIRGFSPYNTSDHGRRILVEACSFQNFTGTGLDVRPEGCLPPESNGPPPVSGPPPVAQGMPAAAAGKSDDADGRRQVLGAAAAGPPTAWTPRGITGGGAFFAPAFHPTDPKIMTVTTDMGVVFRSSTMGDTWESLSYAEIGGGRPAQVRFTAGKTAYAVNGRSGQNPDGSAGCYGWMPSVSRDFGRSWAVLESPAGQNVATLDTDSTGTQLVLSDARSVFMSRGGKWLPTALHSASAATSLRLAGEPVFTSAGGVVLATNEGVLAVAPARTAWADATVSFQPWHNATEAIFGFAAAEDTGSGAIRAYVLTAPTALVAAGMMVEAGFSASLALYTTVLPAADATAVWTRVQELPALVGSGGSLGATHVRMVPGDADTVYVAGQCAGDCSFGPSTGGYPFVMQAEKAGGPWQHILRGNQNTKTGWEGQWGDGTQGDGWSWGGGALSFTAAAAASGGDGDDGKHRLAFTDDGFLHASFDGGEVWSAMYVRAAQRNPIGATVPQQTSWDGNGLMDQSSHWVAWASADNVFAGYTDIRGTISKDGAKSWSYHYDGHKLNTMYRCVADAATSTLYAATSSVHDMYQSTHLTDKSIDTGDGLVLASSTGGSTWHTVFDFKMPVVWIAAGVGGASTRLYAAAVHSTRGGIFFTPAGVSGTKPAQFVKLPNPPRTQGHPYTIEPLPDGALVVSYSGRMVRQRLLPVLPTASTSFMAFQWTCDSACFVCRMTSGTASTTAAGSSSCRPPPPASRIRRHIARGRTAAARRWCIGQRSW